MPKGGITQQEVNNGNIFVLSLSWSWQPQHHCCLAKVSSQLIALLSTQQRDDTCSGELRRRAEKDVCAKRAEVPVKPLQRAPSIGRPPEPLSEAKPDVAHISKTNTSGESLVCLGAALSRTSSLSPTLDFISIASTKAVTFFSLWIPSETPQDASVVAYTSPLELFFSSPGLFLTV